MYRNIEVLNSFGRGVWCLGIEILSSFKVWRLALFVRILKMYFLEWGGIFMVAKDHTVGALVCLANCMLSVR